MVSNMNNSSIGANLISCGGVGFVRFWNVHVGKLLGEYQAHTDGIISDDKIYLSLIVYF